MPRLAGMDRMRHIRGVSSVFQSNPKILGGEVVFKGTRVPLQNLIDYLESGYSIDEFVDHFPTVKKAQAIRGLKEAKSLLAHA
jgi:uncharacterized protein (DUF433 family)